jgi:hypothetical protein
MKSFLPAAIVLCITTASHAVSNRGFESLDDLAKIGFVFTPEDRRPPDTSTFRVRIPKEFRFDEELGSKPFSSASLVYLKHKVKHGPALIEAPGTYTPLEARTTDDGGHEARVSVPLAQAGRSYLQITFAYPSRPHGSNDWPMLIHVPVSDIVKQLEARQAAAPGTPSVPDSGPSPKK